LTDLKAILKVQGGLMLVGTPGCIAAGMCPLPGVACVLQPSEGVQSNTQYSVKSAEVLKLAITTNYALRL